MTFLSLRSCPRSNKKRQKLLRNYGVSEILIKILQIPFKRYYTKPPPHAISLKDVGKPEYADVKEVCVIAL